MVTGFSIYPGLANPMSQGTGFPGMPGFSPVAMPIQQNPADSVLFNPTAAAPVIPFYQPGSVYSSPSPIAKSVPLGNPPMITAEMLGVDKDIVTPEIANPALLPPPWVLAPNAFVAPTYRQVVQPYAYPVAQYYPWSQPTQNPAAQPMDNAKSNLQNSSPPPPSSPPEQKSQDLPKQLPDAEAITPQLIEQLNTDFDAVGDENTRKSAADKLAKILQENPDILDTSKPYASRQYRPYMEALIIKALKDNSSDVRRPVMLDMLPGGLNAITPRIADQLKQLANSNADLGVEKQLVKQVLSNQMAKQQSLQNIQPIIPAQSLVQRGRQS